MAPSSTRSARSTSMVKSTWPGVSMMLTLMRLELVLRALPDAVRRRRLDGDALLALEIHRVHLGADAVLAAHLVNLVDAAGVEKDALGERRLPGVDVGRDTDVADAFEGDAGGQGIFSSARGTDSGAGTERPRTPAPPYYVGRPLATASAVPLSVAGISSFSAGESWPGVPVRSPRVARRVGPGGPPARSLRPACRRRGRSGQRTDLGRRLPSGSRSRGAANRRRSTARGARGCG